MPISTPAPDSPKEDTLLFIRAFARYYTPADESENGRTQSQNGNTDISLMAKC